MSRNQAATPSQFFVIRNIFVQIFEVCNLTCENSFKAVHENISVKPLHFI